MAKVIWSDKAVGQLKAILDFIAEDDPSAASHFGESVMQHVGHLAQFPELGAVVRRTGRREYRNIVHGNYVVTYFQKGDGVYVSRIVHGSRKQK